MIGYSQSSQILQLWCICISNEHLTKKFKKWLQLVRVSWKLHNGSTLRKITLKWLMRYYHSIYVKITVDIKYALSEKFLKNLVSQGVMSGKTIFPNLPLLTQKVWKSDSLSAQSIQFYIGLANKNNFWYTYPKISSATQMYPPKTKFWENGQFSLISIKHDFTVLTQHLVLD